MKHSLSYSLVVVTAFTLLTLCGTSLAGPRRAGPVPSPDFDKSGRVILDEKQKETAEAHMRRGITFYNEGRYDDAINSLTKSIAMDSGNAVPHIYLALAARQKGWHEAAAKELETAASLQRKAAILHPLP